MDYIFERISPHLFPSLIKKEQFLRKIEQSGIGLQFRGATLLTNPPLLIFRDRGNIYVLRKKLEGIHSEEALDQLRTSPSLREMNRAVGMDSAMVKTINGIRNFLEARFKSRFRQEIEDLTYFLSWEIKRNIPRVQVDISGVSPETIWIA